jgi:ribosome-interacting GTPase 1
MADFSEEIEKIKKEIRETPYHKATEHHVGKLRARLAKLKDRQIESLSKGGGGGGGGFSIKKQGDATIVLVGPPSSGKSTLINLLTNAESKVAPYSFTTVSVIPGMLKYNDAYIQILDVPGLIEGASKGKGRGREVISVVRGSDLLILMTDVGRRDLIKTLIWELHEAGIRINETRPEVLITKKAEGGLQIQTNIRQELGRETLKEISQEFGVKNADITIKEKLTFERAIDTFSQNRVFVPALFVINKVDLSPKDTSLEANNEKVYISAAKEIGIEQLKEQIWNVLRLVRVYLVRPGEEPSFHNPMIMNEGQSLYDLAQKLGSEFLEGKSLAKIWGPSAHFPGQEVSLATKVREGIQVRFI